MLQFSVFTGLSLADAVAGTISRLRRRIGLRTRLRGEGGQTTAEYALVILAAAAVALVLIAWARSSGKLPAFFDQIIDDIIQDAQ
jgi:Flp pilus assembly pilin Flp